MGQVLQRRDIHVVVVVVAQQHQVNRRKIVQADSWRDDDAAVPPTIPGWPASTRLDR